MTRIAAPAAAAVTASPTSRSTAASSPAKPSDIGQVASSAPTERRAHHARQVLGGQHRRWQPQPAALRLRVLEQRRTGPEPRRQAHHEVLAQRVDRRVGDLREALLEVGEQRRRAVHSAGSAPSAPIEPVGSLPVAAIGASGCRGLRACSRTRAAAAPAVPPARPRRRRRDVVEPDRCSAAHVPYGRRDAISHSTSRSANSAPRSRSTIHSGPASAARAAHPLRLHVSTPASEARMTRSSV